MPLWPFDRCKLAENALHLLTTTNTPARPACQARSPFRRGELVSDMEALRVEPALLAGNAGVAEKYLSVWIVFIKSPSYNCDNRETVSLRA